MARRHDPEWRLFEALVARIERDAGSAGIRVTSPDRLRCRVTGRLREVDASIVRSDGHLTTIECRKRRGRQDVTWIEQLATKRRSLGADRTIAVSSEGFSQASCLLAGENGIELKELHAIAEDKLNSAAGLNLVLFWHPKAAVTAAELRYAREKPWQVPAENDVDFSLPLDTDLDAPIFRNLEEGHSWSLNDVWRQLRSAVDPFKGLVKGEAPVVRTACFPYPNNVSVQTPVGEKRLGDLIFSVAVWLECESVWQADATKVSYGTRGQPALQRVEFVSSQCEQDWWISLQIAEGASEVGALRTGGRWPDWGRGQAPPT